MRRRGPGPALTLSAPTCKNLGHAVAVVLSPRPLSPPLVVLSLAPRRLARRMLSGVAMLVWGLILLLLTAAPAPAQTLKELFVDAQRAKLAALQDEAKSLAERKARTRADVTRRKELRKEMREVEDRLRALENRSARAR